MTKNNDYDLIMQAITAGLTGDVQKDMADLNEQMTKYRNHKMAKEILRACGRLMYDMISDEDREELIRMTENSLTGINATLEEVQFNIYKKDYDKALHIITGLVEHVEAMNLFRDDEVNEYHDFNELFEGLLYQFLNHPDKYIRHAVIPFSVIYSLYGSLLFEMERYYDAQEALEKGLRWNPVHFVMMTEYIETYKALGNLERFFELTIDAFRIAFKSEHVARCFRNLGYYFIEKELWAEAVTCYFLSMQYDEDKSKAQSELYYISTKIDPELMRPTMTDLKTFSRRYGFPEGADEDVINLALSYGKYFYDKNDNDKAVYFLDIAYDLTNDDNIAEFIAQISSVS